MVVSGPSVESSLLQYAPPLLALAILALFGYFPALIILIRQLVKIISRIIRRFLPLETTRQSFNLVNHVIIQAQVRGRDLSGVEEESEEHLPS